MLWQPVDSVLPALQANSENISSPGTIILIIPNHYNHDLNYLAGRALWKGSDKLTELWKKFLLGQM